TGFEVRHLQVSCKAPLETRKKSLFHSLEINRCFVGSQDQLFTGLVKMVEDVEEYILCFFFACKKLDIIENKHINHLVKMNEVILRIIFYCIDKLVCKFFRRYIQHCLSRVLMFYF